MLAGTSASEMSSLTFGVSARTIQMIDIMPGAGPIELASRPSYRVAERTQQRLEAMVILMQEDPEGNLKTLEWSTVVSKGHLMILSIALIATAHLLIRSSARVITNSRGHRPCFLPIPRTITTKMYSWKKRCSRLDLLSWALRAVNITGCRSPLTPATTTLRFSRKRPGRACVPSRLLTKRSLTQLYRAVWTN